MRHVPRGLPNVPGAQGRDGLAARASAADARPRRAQDRGDAVGARAPRSVSRLPRLRDRVSFDRALRRDPREDANGAPSGAGVFFRRPLLAMVRASRASAIAGLAGAALQADLVEPT